MRAGPDPRALRWTAVRIGLLGAVLLAGLLVVAGRVFWLQVLRRDGYAREAADQYLRELVLRPRRGVVTDRNGVLLAVSADARSVYADPKLLAGDGKEAARARRSEILRQVARILGLDARALERKAQKEGRFVWLERRISPQRGAALQAWLDAEKVTAIRLVPETRRYYPKSEIAGQLLGVVDEEGGGREGVELAEDELLLGAPERVPSLRDGKGHMVLSDAFTPGSEREGARVVLTLDQSLQVAAERALARAVSSSGASSGMAVVLQPGTGEVLALATYPVANANAPRTPAQLRDRPVVDQFEPGSTLKVVTIAAALDAGAVRPTDVIDCGNGKLAIGRTAVIHDTHPIVAADPARILIESSNIGAARIAARLGPERLRDALLAFGFGEKPGLDLPGEVRGVVSLATGDVALATQAFGQGPITASAVQITNAMAVIANRGAFVRPRIVKQVIDPATGETLEASPPEPPRQVIRPEIADLLTRWLVRVVEDEKGTGKRARIEGWRVAGKTGTAQKADGVGGRGYSSERFSSFVGFAPAEAPRFVIGIFIDAPRTDTYGGQVAAPAFREVAEVALRLNAAKPLAEVLASATPAEEPTGEQALDDPEPLAVEWDGGAAAPAGDGSVTVPPLAGLPARAAIRALERADLAAEVSGSGHVVRQAPPPGRKVARGTRVRMTLVPAG